MRKNAFLSFGALLFTLSGLILLIANLSTLAQAASGPYPELSYFALLDETNQHTFASVTKSMMPMGQVDYGDVLTYTVAISAAPGTQLALYDHLEGTTFTRFVSPQVPTGITQTNGVITGTLTVTPTQQLTISFVVQVSIPSTAGRTVSVTNRTCVYPIGGTIENDCIWSNEVTNDAFRPYCIHLPSVARNWEKTFKLGILGPFSGPNSWVGDEFEGAVNMALEAIDWRIGEYKVEPIWIDSQSNSTEATQACERAIAQDGVQAGLLNWHSSVAVACMEVAADHQVPHFFGLGATDVVNEKFDSDLERYGYWTTKGWPIPDKLSISYVQMLNEAIGSGAWSPAERTVAIYGEDTGWGHFFGDSIKGHFGDAGWTIVKESYFVYTETDFYALLDDFTEMDPDPAVIAGTCTNGDTFSALINQADEVGLESLIIADGLNWTGDWYGRTGAASNYVIDQFPKWTTSAGDAFSEAFENRYGFTPSPEAAGLAYDFTNFFIEMSQAAYQTSGRLSSDCLYDFVQERVWTGEWTYTDGIVMEEYKYTPGTIPDPVVGQDYYIFPVVQYFDGQDKVIFPPEWAEQPLTPPGG